MKIFRVVSLVLLIVGLSVLLIGAYGGVLDPVNEQAFYGLVAFITIIVGGISYAINIEFPE